MTNRYTDLMRSLLLLAVVVGFALVGLMLDHNWPKVLRVSLAAGAYASVLLLFARLRRRSVNWDRTLPVMWFTIAGACAGVVSGLVRPQFRLATLVIGIMGGALLLGTVHWLALANWRRLRKAISD